METRELTRRAWLDRLPVPLLAAGAIGLSDAAEPNQTPPSPRGAGIYNVRDFGAKGDGKTLDTKAIQSAIDDCFAAGGGTILLPEGKFLTGTIELKSNVTLHIAASGELTGTTDGTQYHAVDAIPLSGDSTLEDGNWAHIFAVNAKNVTIEGPGLIDGKGIAFHPPHRGAIPPSGIGGNRRPYTLLFYKCKNLRIRYLDLIRSAYHCIRVIQSDRVYIDQIYIHNRVNGNNDGFHFISARHVTISNCIVESQDDACALFGNCRFVTITNSSFSTRWSVFRFGGGEAENITVSNCLLYQVYGCPIKFHGGPGSRFENIAFSNLVLDDVTGPIHLHLGPPTPRAANQPPIANETSGRPPAVARNISFSNIRGSVTTNPGELPDFPFASNYRPGEGHSCITLNCVGDAVIENISFDAIHLTFGGGGTAEEAARRDLPQIAGEYFMLGPMPAYGFYARKVTGITLQNVRFQLKMPDARPALILDNVTQAGINGLSVEASTEAESAVRFIDTKEVLFTATRLLSRTSVFLQLEGAGNERIVVDGGDVSKAQTPLKAVRGATDTAVKLRT